MSREDGYWVGLADGVLARRYAELDLTVGLVVGGERALVVDTGLRPSWQPPPSSHRRRWSAPR